MITSGAMPRSERDHTDASLQAERAKTDTELAKRQDDVHADADRVVELARVRAEATLDDARDRADRSLKSGSATIRAEEALAREREAEDRAVAEERDVAEERLRVERAEQQRALSALLDREREATDDGLFVERARADATVATRDEFLAMVSHDLRTMLGTIAMNATILVERSRAQGGADGGGARHAERIQRSTARMTRLVGDLLDVVSLEAGKLRLVLEAHDALDLVNEATAAFVPSFAAKGVTLTLDAPETSIMMDLDYVRLLQVLANLLGNALKFTEPGGKVVLSLARAADDVRFAVTDTGPGIPADRREAVFERFQQATSDGRGLGLGLYIAKCIVEAHGGAIRAESQEPRGAAVRFTIPVHAPGV